jgi:hypothetical protein
MTTTDSQPPEFDPAEPGRTRTERRHEIDRAGEQPRRAMAVGRVWIVGIVCLLVGALLNAPGIRRTALSQDVGWKRDVATFFADPLYDVSHTLYFDRLREGLQDVSGRSGDDDVNESLPSPVIDETTPTTVVNGQGVPATTTTTNPRKKEAFTPQHQAAMWVGGDSLSITPGESVVDGAIATQVIGLLQPVDGHVATGLARPEVFNWPAYLADVVAREHPDIMVLTIGSNDDQSLTGDMGVGGLGSPAWVQEYRRRVGGLMDSVTKDGKVTLFWVGIPPMRNVTRFETRYKLINEIIKTEAEKRPGKVHFVDTVPVLADANGNYADFLVKDGAIVKVRSGDGIHFERAGADLIANAVLAKMGEAFDLTSWKDSATTNTTTTAPTTTAPTTTSTKTKRSK